MATQNQVASATDHQPDEVINWSDDEDNEDNSGNGAASSDPFAASHSETDGLVISSSTEGINEDEALADAPDSAFDHDEKNSFQRASSSVSVVSRESSASAAPKSKHRPPQLWEPIIVDHEVSSYELEREARLAQNRAILKELGILKDGSFSLTGSNEEITPKPKKVYRKRSDIDPETYQTMMSELKRSRRLLGADPEQIRFGKASSQLGNPEVFSQAFSDSGTEDDDDDIFDHSGMIGMSKIRKRRLGAGVDLVAGLRDDPITVAPPFSLGFTKLTIWELGKIVKDESKRENYWSQKTCRYRHQYPVGFKATKSQYGYDWTMTIEEGEDGPVFKVIADDDSLPEFSGPSPTSPWTDVCMTVLGKNSKTRVSGPHQFGFTDPFLQVVIFGMPDHPRIQDMTTLRLVSRQARRGLRFGGRDGAKRKRGRPRNGTGPSEAQANKALVTGQLVDVDWDSVLETERVAELARREERRAKAEAEERERRKAEGRAVSGSGSGPGNGMALRRSTSSSTPTMLGNGLTFARNSSLEKGSIRMKDEYDEHGDREMMEVEVEVDEEITDDDNAFIEPRIVGGREFRPRKPPKRFRKVIKKMLVPVPKRKSGGGGGGGGSSKKSSATGPTGTTMEQSKATAAATAAITINGQEQTPPSKTAPSKQPSRETPAQVEFEKPPPEILARASDPNDDVIYCICELPESDYWNTVACDFCNIWLHMECVGYIDPETMDRSKHHTVKGLHRDGRWKCPRCRKEVRVLG